MDGDAIQIVAICSMSVFDGGRVPHAIKSARHIGFFNWTGGMFHAAHPILRVGESTNGIHQAVPPP